MKSSTSNSEIFAGCSLVAVLFVAIFLAVNAAIAFIMMVAWNLVFPSLFGFQAISYLNAFGITLIISVLRMLLFGVRGSISDK